jgi:hypothetical protein
MKRFLTPLVITLLAAPAGAQGTWPDSYLTRLQAQALMERLNGDLLASRSATLVLEGWCRDHDISAEPRIVADRMEGAARSATAEQRVRLDVSDTTTLVYRRVRLTCGGHVLSEAENWYVPGRLTPDMNRTLETTTMPFGRVVAPLEPYRRTFLAERLWSALPAGWDRSGLVRSPCATRGPLAIPAALFRHQALLFGADHRPIAEVHEVYQRGIFDFPAPGPC